MRQSFISMEFYETYYYANIIHNVLTDPFPYIRNLHSWYEDREVELLLPSFPKWSRLHSLAGYIVDSVIDEEVSDIAVDAVANDPQYEVWVDRALAHHQYEHPGFRSWLKERSVSQDELTEDHLADYHSELYLAGNLTNLVEQISEEVFYILFGNRRLLANLNDLLARTVQRTFSDELNDEIVQYFDRPGKLKRVAMPEWVKRAVFHRDRGMCSSCNKDVSGLVSAQPDKHYDHIVPLAIGGLNDVTNIQLLCESCNVAKAAQPIQVTSIYESWY